MSSTSAISAAATPTATPAACGALTFEIPVSDAACAMPYGGDKNHTAVMGACCGDHADVVAYRGDCGIYCLAIGQSVADLTACLYDHGAAWGDVFCSGNNTATATATDGGLPPATASVSASVVVTAGAESSSSSGDDGDSGSDGDSDGGDQTSSGDAPDGSEGAAAPGLRPEFGGAKAGLVIGALLFSATAFGALQL
ncbi:hypothetical protein SLS62_008641 [Diatrype stigma]|uniref:Uncharacterized protein n=1 Tax=Diatrype stigma TaxID=117547 RepID=A0AAN9UJ07_9PEZI